MGRNVGVVVAMLTVVGVFADGSPRRRAVESSRAVPPGYRHLCTLQAKPGNAFTFVRPLRPQAPEAGTLAGGATINVTYVGFNAFPGAQAAFQYAVDLWRAEIGSPVAITVQAQFALLPGTQLGSAGARISHMDVPNGIPTTFYGDPLADRVASADQDPGEFDILASFDSDANWYFGTDGNVPGGKYDFVSVVLHELGHGLGFAGSAYMLQGGLGGVGADGIPEVFDHFAVTEDGAALLGFPNETAELGQQMTSAYNAGDPRGPGVYWGGPAGKAANAGLTPRLYTPANWLSGSSYSHLDEDTYPEGNPNSLMTFAISAAEAVHAPGPVTLGMFQDMGWNGQPELITNGDFSNGMVGWTPFASVTDSNGVTTPDIGYIQYSIFDGRLEYYRVAPTHPETATSAVVLQDTGVAFGAGEQMVATFQAGNSSATRKRISVLIHDQGFSDLSVCTFWMPPFAPILTYRMLTHTTKAWSGASISFYAASAGSNGGNYQVDNVSLRPAPTAVAAETRCIDPWFALAVGAPDGAEMLNNGGFDTGTLPPWWQTYGTLTPQIAGGVLQFTRDSDAGPAGVVLQPTGQAAAADSILTATFELGNSSAVRKRVTVLMHDLYFSDLSACTFWLAPGQPLKPYLMRAYVTDPMLNVTLSVYAASVGTEQWTRLDNASLKVTPGKQTFGADCGEPGGALVAGRYVLLAGPPPPAPEAAPRTLLSRPW
jgi:hypothetical protein